MTKFSKISKLADILYVGHALVEDATGHKVVMVGDYTPFSKAAKIDVLERVEYLHPGNKPLDVAVYKCERILEV
jgi:hypothetical protein